MADILSLNTVSAGYHLSWWKVKPDVEPHQKILKKLNIKCIAPSFIAISAAGHVSKSNKLMQRCIDEEMQSGWFKEKFVVDQISNF